MKQTTFTRIVDAQCGSHVFCKERSAWGGAVARRVESSVQQASSKPVQTDGTALSLPEPKTATAYKQHPHTDKPTTSADKLIFERREVARKLRVRSDQAGTPFPRGFAARSPFHRDQPVIASQLLEVLAPGNNTGNCAGF
jgi:hypothetical protein